MVIYTVNGMFSFSLSLEKTIFIFILPIYRPHVYLSFAQETLIQVDVALTRNDLTALLEYLDVLLEYIDLLKAFQLLSGGTPVSFISFNSFF